VNTWAVRAAGFFALASTLWCGPWLLLHLNVNHLWISVPFTIALGMTMTLTLATFITEWRRSTPDQTPVVRGAEPVVGVLIPTLGEPVRMLARTAESIMAQDWPHERLVVIISDDAHSAEVATEVARLRAAYPRATIRYNSPPLRGTAARRGTAKAGNLNSALDYLREHFPDVRFIETRDADDEVGDPGFLRQTIGLLVNDPNLAYVQTIKSARVSEGDPFNNLEPLFYYGNMLARHDGNSVFPCGSGLVWRLEALEDIGDFPTWSLVEDLMSGVEALKRGWNSAYLPIVGAVAQHAPEDMANVYKQRGTWSLDTLRIMFWGDLKGLTLRQKVQFSQLAFYYLHSLATIVFILVLPISLVTNIYPMNLSGFEATYRFWPLIVSSELFLIALNGRHPFETAWRLKEMLIGLTPVYAKSFFRAVFDGPDKSYAYRVTRKTDDFHWYWRETRVQIGAMAVLSGALLYRVVNTASWSAFDMGLAYLTMLQILPLAGFIRKSWFGVSPLRRSVPAVQTTLSAEPGD
jgi:cellulose synthase (UDP-forming)